MMMFDRNQDHIPFNRQVEHYSSWLIEKAKVAKAFFVSVAFGVARDRYLVDAHDDRAPTRIDVAAGLTRQMPIAQALEVQCGDVRRWYLRGLGELFGGKYKRHRQFHPTAIGWLDKPAPKRFTNDNARKRLPDQKFPNGHMVMLVPDVPDPRGGRLIDRFQRLADDQALDQLWRKLNPDGHLHVTEACDVAGALDYAAKTARRDPVYRDHMIMLPFAGLSSSSAKIANNDNQR